jgi:hypothetical protein
VLTVRSISLRIEQPPGTVIFSCSVSDPNGLSGTVSLTCYDASCEGDEQRGHAICAPSRHQTHACNEVSGLPCPRRALHPARQRVVARTHAHSSSMPDLAISKPPVLPKLAVSPSTQPVRSQPPPGDGHP